MFSSFKIHTKYSVASIPAVFQFTICRNSLRISMQENHKAARNLGCDLPPDSITPSFLHTLKHSLYLITHLLKSLRKGVIISHIRQYQWKYLLDLIFVLLSTVKGEKKQETYWVKFLGGFLKNSCLLSDYKNLCIHVELS